MRIALEYRYCASCHSQKIGVPHVDFEAYYDGPSIKELNGDYSSVDDLIICVDCLAEAGKLVGLFPADDLKKENEQLGEAVVKKDEEIKELHDIVSDLERTLNKFVEAKIVRPGRKPKIVEKVA